MYRLFASRLRFGTVTIAHTPALTHDWNAEVHGLNRLARREGFEPSLTGLEAVVLPLHHRRTMVAETTSPCVLDASLSVPASGGLTTWDYQRGPKGRPEICFAFSRAV
jgi:hypothetical protein